MRLGFHISIAGGFSRVVPRTLKKGCEAVQFFSRSPRAWTDGSLNPSEVERYREALSQTDISPVFLHAPYLLNLASPNPELYTRSITYLSDELRRAQVLGAQFVIVHVGNRLTNTEAKALASISRAIDSSFAGVNNSVQLLLENTAGQGTEIGYQFNQLQSILEQLQDKRRIGICLDIAHAFEAGYDLSTSKGLDRLLDEFDTLIGLDKLKVLHLNDSRSKSGSRVDRHWHIGEGEIGLSGFRNIVNHAALMHLPGIMETPRKTDADDLKNMAVMRSLIN